MPEYYIRVEGVNLSSFLEDTEDLSTVRGASFLLSQMPEFISRRTNFKTVSKGASAGLFLVTAADDQAASSLCDEIRKEFAASSLRHATIVVDFLKKLQYKSFQWHSEAILAKNRYRQMRAPSLAVPTPASGDEPCNLDGVRPAHTRITKGGTDFVVSGSVFARRQKGLAMKDQIFPYLASAAYKCVDDFSELCDSPPREWQHLKGKIAVLHLDGNGFGEIQGATCQIEQDQRLFDQNLRDKVKSLLHSLVAFATEQENSALWLRNDLCRTGVRELRLEVLLLAGDEIRLVVPAWNGWRTLKFLFEQIAAWTASDAQGSSRLTYGSGLVFCGSHAPIHRVKSLAADLASYVKDVTRAENAMSYQVLESFDHLGQPVTDYRNTYGLPGGAPKDYVLTASDMDAFEKKRRYLADFPKNKLHDIVHAFFAGDSAAADSAKKRAVRELSPEGSRAAGAMTAPDWMHLLELWDYVG